MSETEVKRPPVKAARVILPGFNVPGSVQPERSPTLEEYRQAVAWGIKNGLLSVRASEPPKIIQPSEGNL